MEKKTRIISFLALIVFLFGIFFYSYNKERMAVYSTVYSEAGAYVSMAEFLADPDYTLSVLNDESDKYDFHKPGEYNLTLSTGSFVKHRVKLVVSDTIPPEAEAVDKVAEYGQKPEALEFVKNISDATDVTVSYDKEPDFSKAGTQYVYISLKDEGDNETVLKAKLFLSIVKPDLYIEAGDDKPEVQDFLVVDYSDYSDMIITRGLADIDTNLPGDYEVGINFNNTNIISNVHIRDTIAPVIALKNINSFTTIKRKPEDFILSAEDATELTFSFAEAPDINFEGTQQVKVIAKDAGGNETAATARLSLLVDNEPPVISGVKDIVVIKGNTISYKKGVTVTDNCTENLSFTVDTSNVNPKAIGEYPIVYIARDASGNETRIEAKINIKAFSYDEATVHALADKVLASIINKKMTPMEKTRAVYDYLKRHIRYKRQTNYTDPLKATYDGITTGKGDCFVYSSTARVLLSRAGITVMQINKIPAETVHYWDLVNLGNGWYHFDACPMRDNRVFFMWGDDQLMEYSNSHNKSHNYDRSLFPAVNAQ